MIRLITLSIVSLLFAGSAPSASEIRRVVTGLDPNGKAVVLFDAGVPLSVGKSGAGSVNLWITDSSPPGFSFNEDAATKPIGLSPPDKGTTFRVVEFPPLDPTVEAKLEPNLMMKIVRDHAPARGLPVATGRRS